MSSTTLVLTPLDDRGVQILDALDELTMPFARNLKTGARSYWVNADQAPPDFNAALAEIDPTWTEHVHRG